MRAVNTTRGVELAAHVERAATFGARFMGLMGRAALPDGHALLLEACTSVHTCFMRFPIDVAFVRRDGEVVALYAGLRPWRSSGLHLRADDVLELPAGVLTRSATAVGDRLAWVEDAPKEP